MNTLCEPAWYVPICLILLGKKLCIAQKNTQTDEYLEYTRKHTHNGRQNTDTAKIERINFKTPLA